MSEEKKYTTAESLRLLADWYETHPTADPPNSIGIWLSGWGDRQKTLASLAHWAMDLKPCVKELTDYNFSLNRQFGNLTFNVSVSRDAVCKKIVTYDCPESLLAALGEENLAGLETE